MKKLLLLCALTTALFANDAPKPDAKPPEPKPTVESLTKERDELKADLAAVRQQLTQAQASIVVLSGRIRAIESQRNEAMNQAAIAQADLANAAAEKK